MGLVSEIRRRNVFRMAVLYAVAAWLAMQVAEVVMGLANLPEWIGPTILALLAIGFPIALLFSWFYELTPEGISLDTDIDTGQFVKPTAARRFDFIVISLLVAAVIMFAYDKWWVPGPADKSIAVLAFENMSGDPDQEYFSDGISEELLNLLAKIPELHVTSRSSAFSFKGEDVDIPTVARQLNVAHVLEGSVRKIGNRVRVTVQLIDANSDSHLWSESYDRDLDDIFAVQDEIAAAISKELRVKLVRDTGGKAPTRESKAATTDAYDAYLKGREFVNLRTPESLWRAGLQFERALRLDPNFAPAHAQLAIVTLLDTDKSIELEWEGGIETATLHLARAQELNPDLADAHAGRALLALSINDPESVIDHAQKALAINPSYADAMNWLQMAYSRLGQYLESDEVVKKMVAIDPLTVVGRFHLVRRLNWAGRHAEAHAEADRLLALSTLHGYTEHARTSLFYEGDSADGLFWALKCGQDTGNYNLAWQAFLTVGEYEEVRRLYDEADFFIDAAEGRWDEAIAVIQEALQLYPHLDYFVLDAGDLFYRARRFEEALQYYERFFEAVPNNRLHFILPTRGPLFESFPVIRLMRLAQTRRVTGDEMGARATAQFAREENAKLRAAGRENNNRDLAEAMIAAFDGQSEAAINALRSAIGNGLWATLYLNESVFDTLRDEPGFVLLQKEFDRILTEERNKVLQLACFNNPTPEDWQPLPETCEGVVERPPGP